ncbi:DoxX family protein [Cereibacter johrii]|uniref:Oxidoreductase n=1 Tax=Cereibacter johrii TaxID=445629 RepID=A0ABX5J7U8_9RHOB|nr:DoxX family protein [Cereibacter johrii]MEA5160327.1 DoxX family protein [Cereibacter johrii]ODM45000.1 DoxX family protein [Cereibacter johrii]PTM78177.1 putative oxidoreductase [Cereibacter johrii]RAZ85154.1 DoxX family protein [Cereibacter johrii]
MSHISNERPALLLPALAPVYAAATPLTDAWLRVVCGAALMIHGWPKIQNPTGAADMVSGLGFAPGWFWSILLSVTEFTGGLLLVLGLLTRLAAAGTTIILLVATYFHWVVLGQGYSGAELAWLWAAVTLSFVAKGGGRYSVDHMLKKEL